MASFFPLPHKATWKKRQAPTATRSGQKTAKYETTGTTIQKCLFFGTTGNKRGAPRQDYDQTIAFYVGPEYPIEAGDLIENVTGKDGIWETGPFEVISARKVTSFGGKVHHISCMLKGIMEVDYT
jgi:hypothetical protein